MTKAWLFAYGSIQPGCWNAIPGLVIGDERRGSVRGEVYWAGWSGSYPVAFLQHAESETQYSTRVHGTWMEVDLDSQEWEIIFRMESGAGYRLVTVTDTDQRISGLAWHFRAYKPAEDLRIHSGDWLSELRGSRSYEDDEENFDEDLDNIS